MISRSQSDTPVKGSLSGFMPLRNFDLSVPQEMRREAKMIHDEDRPTLSFGMVTSDGEGVAFRIERGGGKFLDLVLVCTMDDLSDIFYYLASLAMAAGEEREIALNLLF